MCHALRVGMIRGSIRLRAFQKSHPPNVFKADETAGDDVAEVVADGSDGSDGADGSDGSGGADGVDEEIGAHSRRTGPLRSST